MRLKPDLNNYGLRAFEKQELGDIQGAINDYNIAISLKPDNSSNYHIRGILKRKLGNTQGAISDYNTAISLQPDFAGAYSSRGLTKYSLGDSKNGLTDLKISAILYQKQGKENDYRETVKIIQQLNAQFVRIDESKLPANFMIWRGRVINLNGLSGRGQQ